MTTASPSAPLRLSTIAPAGCGKTHLIVTSVQKLPTGQARTLVLTHTNAGVSVLEKRFNALSVPAARYTVETIDGWCLRLVRAFPSSADLRLGDPLPAWPIIHAAAERAIKKPFFRDVLTSSYGRIYVDEYQDCSPGQHAVVVSMSEIIEARALGDPLQAIFTFGEAKSDQLSWTSQVCAAFPLEKRTWRPRRWATNDPLANFVTTLRHQLLSGSPVSLRHAAVELIPDDRQKVINAIRGLDPKSSSMVIRGTRAQCYMLAKSVKSGFRCLEPVNLELLPEFAATVAAGNSRDLVIHILAVVGACTDAGKTFIDRVRKRLLNPSARQRISGVAEEQVLELCRRVVAGGKPEDALVLLAHFESAYVHRPEPFYGLRRVLRSCGSSVQALPEAVERQRERERHIGRRMPARAMGTTYLVKGLESDHVVAMDVHRMGASDLYVALTRAKGRLLVVSSTDTLAPPRHSRCVREAIAGGLLSA